jgi:GT2 family glycosyltransferase
MRSDGTMTASATTSITEERTAIEHSRRAILEEIGDPPDLTVVRVRGNLGDDLIWAGTRELLADRIYFETDLDSLCGARGHTVLLCGSGGFCRPYHELMPRALAVAELRFERVMVLPSSFDPSEDEVREALARTGATVFARERESYGRIRSLCDARIAHDCAFFFDFSPYARAGEGTLNAFRTDREALGAGALPAGNIDISATATSLEEWLRTIAEHELVRTDRAHVMIAAALLGKRVEYRPSSYHKLPALAEFGLDGYPVVRLPSPAPAAASRPGRVAAPQRGAPAGPARVTAIVLSRDRPQRAFAAIDSLAANEIAIETLVIDNNSAPAAEQELAEGCSERNGVSVKRMERNLGCAGGRRVAIEQTDSEFVLLLDDDAELEPGAVDALVADLEAHPRAAAVTATVMLPSGLPQHSGGWMRVSHAVAEFGLLGISESVDRLAPSGPADWVPGGAALIRREVLREFPIEDQMHAYYEDNEWCYRVERARPGSFRRCVEARAVHHLTARTPAGIDFPSRSAAVMRLETHAWFYARHRKLLSIDLFDLVPELKHADGSPDLEAARLLMELLLAKGGDWVLMEWMNGGLDVLLRARTRVLAANSELRELELRLADAHAELAAQRQVIAQQDAHVEALLIRHGQLLAIEQGGWWRLRGRVRPALALCRRIRRSLEQ